MLWDLDSLENLLLINYYYLFIILLIIIIYYLLLFLFKNFQEIQFIYILILILICVYVSFKHYINKVLFILWNVRNITIRNYNLEQ